MLRNIPKNITPELMYVLMQMGHGDEIVFTDANFPAVSMGKRVIRADGDTVENLLSSILPFFPLDHFVEDNVLLMSVVAGKGDEPRAWGKYDAQLKKHDAEGYYKKFSFLSREEFYERSRNAFAIVATGEREKFANIILKLGVVE